MDISPLMRKGKPVNSRDDDDGSSNAMFLSCVHKGVVMWRDLLYGEGEGDSDSDSVVERVKKRRLPFLFFRLPDEVALHSNIHGVN